MKVSSWSLAALPLLAEVHRVSAKAILSPRLILERRDLAADLEHYSLTHDSDLERRSPQVTQPPPANPDQSNNGTLDTQTQSAPVNGTISDACLQALAGKNTTVNAAGWAGCYNILEWDPQTSIFRADLRVYTAGAPRDKFANVSLEMILPLLAYSPITQFTSSPPTRDTSASQEAPQGLREVYQYNLTGHFTAKLDLNKLSEVQIASLLVPVVSMQATLQPYGQTFMTQMAGGDLVAFTNGQFTNLNASEKAISLESATATQAIAISQPFVLPGTTFGIFPVGLIVTSIWATLFFVIYSAGTIARFRYRSVYRQRLSALAGRQINVPTAGRF